MQICIPNIIDTVWNFICANREIIIRVALPLVLSGVFAMLRPLIFRNYRNLDGGRDTFVEKEKKLLVGL